MIWTIESCVPHWDPYPDAVGAGYDFGQMLHQGIEEGMDELDYLQEFGNWCDACGQWRITHHTECEEIGGEPDERMLMGYELCTECRREMAN